MTFESNKFFEMHDVLNKLRGIEQRSSVYEVDPGMEHKGKSLTDANFTRTMARINSLKGAVSDERFNDLKNGIKSIYANHRPNTVQMSALLELLETILGYVADDVTLYNRLRSDISGKSGGLDDSDTEEQPLNNPELAAAGEEDPELMGDEEEDDEFDAVVTPQPRELK